MSAPAINYKDLRAELCTLLAFKTLSRLKDSEIPAFLNTWKGRTQYDVPRPNARSGYTAFKAEFMEIVEENMHIIKTLYPQVPDGEKLSKAMTNVVGDVWFVCQHYGQIYDLAATAHARGCAIKVAEMEAKLSVRGHGN